MSDYLKNFEEVIGVCRLRLQSKSPFFATLSLHSRCVVSDTIPTAATDGRNLFFNSDFFVNLPPLQQDGLLLHELLHAALLHVVRRGVRISELWNIAADIIVNGIIAQQGSMFELPEGGIREPKWEHLSVEEVYELLLKNTIPLTLAFPDLLEPEAEGDYQGRGGDVNKKDSTSSKEAELETYWKDALQQAAIVQRSTQKGTLPAGMERLLGSLVKPQIDWRSYLWKYLVRTPNDFQGFDRRFIYQGLYIDHLEGESVQVFVAVDTSGSIDDEDMSVFLSEVKGILGAYPHLQCELYYVDAAAYGPYSLTSDSNSIPKPQGGGGTSFIPFFDKVEKTHNENLEGVCVYLTDGYGDFPNYIPSLPVLWVVTAGGLNTEQFPFGEVVRLLSI